MRILLAVLGVLDLAFGAFHVSMFWGIAGLHGIPEHLRISAYTFNMMAVLAMAYLGLVFLTRAKEVMTTGLGAATLCFGALLFLWRAARDLIWPTGDYTLLAICAVIGLMHLAVIFGVRRAPA